MCLLIAKLKVKTFSHGSNLSQVATMNRTGVLCSELTSTKKEEDLTPIFTSIALKCDYIKAGLGIKMLWRKSLDGNGSRQKWKMNKMEDDQNGRQLKLKTTK